MGSRERQAIKVLCSYHLQAAAISYNMPLLNGEEGLGEVRQLRQGVHSRVGQQLCEGLVHQDAELVK